MIKTYTIRQMNFPIDGSAATQKITQHQFNSNLEAMTHAQKLHARNYNKYNTIELLLDENMNEVQLPNNGMRTLFILIAISALSVIGLIAWVNL
jgi:hypothetical protein